MRKRMMLLCVAGMLCGGAGGNVQKGWGCGGELEGKEIWRKEMGEERCLLLYKDEMGALCISFTDETWIYATEELVERVKRAGLRYWEEEIRK